MTSSLASIVSAPEITNGHPTTNRHWRKETMGCDFNTGSCPGLKAGFSISSRYLKYRCVSVNVNMNVNMKPSPGFCKRLATGPCYSRMDSGYVENSDSSTGSNPPRHEIRNAGAVQPWFVTRNNGGPIECGLGRGVVAWCSGLEMIGNRSNVVSGW